MSGRGRQANKAGNAEVAKADEAYEANQAKADDADEANGPVIQRG